MQKISSEFILKIRKKIFIWFLDLDIFSLNDKNKNEIIKLFSEDINMLEPLFTNLFGLSIEGIFAVCIGLTICFYFDWRVALICSALIIMTFTLIYLFSTRSNYKKKEKINSDYFSDTIGNIKIIKAYDIKEKLFNFLLVQEQKLKKENINYDKFLFFIGFGVYFCILFLAVALLIYVGGLFVLKLQYSSFSSYIGATSNFFIFLSYLYLIKDYIFEYNLIHDTISKINVILNQKYLKNKKKDVRVFPEENLEYNLNVSDISFDATPKRGKIEFKNVSFTYSANDKTKVLDNINFIVNPGSKVGFVGVSGSGKSTIIQLLLRFYDINEGEIFVDDVNIKKYDANVLRNYFSGVFQEPDLFERSILENIKYGNLNASKSDVEKAADIACVPKIFLDERNYQSISQISGGEKQRIAIARCLLKDSKIMFFDEATSALDAKNDNEINNNLKKYFKSLVEKKTILIIAHR